MLNNSYIGSRMEFLDNSFMDKRKQAGKRLKGNSKKDDLPVSTPQNKNEET